MARTKINDKQLEKIVSSDKVDGQSLNITGSGNALSTLSGGDHFLVQQDSSTPQKISANVMQDFFSLTDIHNSEDNEAMHITFVSGSGNSKKIGIQEDGALTYNPSTNLLIASGNVRSARFEIDSAADYLDVSTDLQIVAAADILLDPGGGDVKVDGNLLPNADDTSDLGSTAAAWQDLHLEGDILFQDSAEIDVAAGDLTVDVAGDIALSADGGNVTMSDGTTTVFDFDTDNVVLKIMDDADTGDFASIGVAADGATTFTTVDDDGTSADLTFTVDGDIILDPAGNNVLPGSDSADDLGRDAGTTNPASGFSASSDFATLGLGGNLLRPSIGHVRITTSGLSAVSGVSTGNTLTVSESGNTFEATVADTPSGTRTILENFASNINDASLTGGSTTIDISSNSAAFIDVVVGDAIELKQLSPSSVTFTATVASISSSSIGLSSVSISGGSSLSVSAIATSTIKGAGIPVSSASITAGSAFSPSGGSTVTFAAATSRVAWREIFVDNVNLNGQGKLKLDDDGDTHISSPADDVIEVFAGDAHALSVSGSTVDVLVGLVAKGDVDLGNATSDTITATGRFDSDLVPSSNSARSLGSSTLQWANIHADEGNIDTVVATQLTASAIRVTELDVVTINSINQTEQTLEIEDKLIVAAVSASAANASGGGLRVGGADGTAAGYFSILFDSGSTHGHKIDFNVQVSDGGAEVTQVFLADGVLAPQTDSDVALGTADKQFSAAHVDVGHIDQLGSALDANSQAITNINVDSGAIDGTAIGAESHSTAKFTTLEATSTVTLSSLAALSASTTDATHHLLVVDEDDNIIKKDSMPALRGTFAKKFAGSGLQEAFGVLSISPVIEMATKFTRGDILSDDFKTASLGHVPLSGSLQVYLNGMLQTPSGSASGDGPQDYTGVLSGSSTHSEELWDYVHAENTGSHYVYFQEALDEDDVVQLRYIKA